MKRKEIAKKNRRLMTIIFTAFLVICFVVGLLCFQYYGSLKNTIREESRDYLLEISKQIGTNIDRNINDNFSALETIAGSLEVSGATDFADFATTIEKLKEHWLFNKIMIVDENNKTYDAEGNDYYLPNAEYLQQAVIGRKSAISAAETIDGVESVVFAIPVNFKLGSVEARSLLASYDLSTFDKILSMTAFNGKGYSHIIRSDGNYIVKSSYENAIETGFNVLNSFSSFEFVDQPNYENIRKDISSGKSGFTEFIYKDAHEYMAYTPLSTKIENSEWRLLTFVPVEVVNVKSSMLINITLLFCGLVTLTFTLLLTGLVLVTFRNKSRLENIAYVDIITGGNTFQLFTEQTKKILSDDSKQYALVYTNIEKFKLLNEQYGRKMCDKLLKFFDQAISSDLDSDESSGRIFADNFCILIKYTNKNDLFDRMSQWKDEFLKSCEVNEKIPLVFGVEFGVYVISDAQLPLSYMMDCAKLALNERAVEIRDNIKFSIFNETMRKLLIREKQLEDMMGRALKENEFKVFLQPKYYAKTESIGGAEALVRWQPKTGGMIYPDEFIPLFEKNHFIIKLDAFVFEKVCKTINNWMKNGLEPIKISVNCSRVHLNNTEFLYKYREIADKYNVPAKYIEIEFTENIVFGNVDLFAEVIEKIHSQGFGCSMDDFGSGYSSLSMIKDVPVDTLKIDKVFFRNNAGEFNARSVSVIESIINMSKALSMQTVAEGVELKEQVQILKQLGCDFIQGYYFAKPQSIKDFEKLAFNNQFETEEEL